MNGGTRGRRGTEKRSAAAQVQDEEDRREEGTEGLSWGTDGGPRSWREEEGCRGIPNRGRGPACSSLGAEDGESGHSPMRGDLKGFPGARLGPRSAALQERVGLLGDPGLPQALHLGGGCAFPSACLPPPCEPGGCLLCAVNDQADRRNQHPHGLPEDINIMLRNLLIPTCSYFYPLEEASLKTSMKSVRKLLKIPIFHLYARLALWTRECQICPHRQQKLAFDQHLAVIPKLKETWKQAV